MDLFKIPLLLEEVMGDANISPVLKQLLADKLYGKRVKFLLDKGFNENIISKAVNLDKRFVSTGQGNNQRDAGKYVVWIAQQLKRNIGGPDMPGFEPPSMEDWMEIFDWARATGPDLMRMDFESALESAIAWHREAPSVDSHTKGQLKSKYKTNNVIYNGPGFKVVKLEEEQDFDVEGKILSLCTTKERLCSYYLGKSKSGSHSYFSLRDNSNEPHVLCEYNNKDNVFEQIQAHGDTVPEEKYKAQLYNWLSNEAPEGSQPNELVIERAMPEDKKKEFIKEIEQKLIEQLEKEASE